MRDAEVIKDTFLGVDHVLDRWPWISGAVRPAGFWIDRRWSRRTETRAGQIGANDEVLVEIDALAVTDQPVPPSRTLVIVVGVLAGNVRACRKGMADEDRVRAVGVQLSKCFVPDREWRDRLSMRELEAIGQDEVLWLPRDERVMHQLRHLDARG